MKKNKPSLSVIVPAFNEEGNILSALTNLNRELQKITDIYEIIVINDGSSDGTGAIVRTLMKKNRHIRFIDRKINKGFGYSVKEGFAGAKKEYLTQFHGDNDSSTSFIKDVIRHKDEADIISTYTRDKSARSVPRRILSRAFIECMKILFGVRLKYYNGAFLCKTALVKNLRLTSTGFAVYAEAKIRLVKRGYTIAEIPFDHIGRKTGNSKAVSLKSFFQTLATLQSLVKDIYILGQP